MTTSNISARIDQYHQQAAGFVGYSNFGSTDDNYLEALRVYLTSVEKEAELTDAGQTMLDQIIVGNLVSRLFTERGIEQYPECLNQPIIKPIIVTGLPRSGTTALHKILASAPSAQTPANWLCSFPMPRPPRETWHGLELYQMVDKAMQAMNESAPELKKGHLFGAAETEECNRVLSHSFSTYALRALPYTPSYGEWVIRQDLTGAYLHHKKVLQLIGSQNQKTWVLKDPLYMPFIDIILKLYPDACIVNACREPSEAVASVCNVMHTFGGPYQKNIDKHEFGRRTSEDYAFMMDRFMELRARSDPSRFLDVSYPDIVSDPVSLAKKIYKHFDIDIGTDGEANLKQWLADNAKDRFGKHSYTLDEYGLSREMVDERFAKYRKKFLSGIRQ